MPERIGQYEVVGEVGHGATGTVYLGHDPQLDRPVALKVLSAAVVDQPGFRERFEAEARLMAEIDDPNCVRIYAFAGGERPYIVSEYVAGATLREVAHRAGRLTPEQSLVVLDGALAGLASLHQRGLVHRDIKPDNIFCDAAGLSKLGDFGLATAAGTAAPAMSAGSANYMSPELVSGEPVDARSDIYACGATLFELLSGAPPYAGGDTLATMRRQQQDPVPDVRKAARGVPAVVGALVSSAMAKAPADRPRDVAEFRARLEEAARKAYGASWRTKGSLAAVAGAAIAAGTAATTALAATGGAAAATAAGAATVGSATVGGTAAASGGAGATGAAGVTGAGSAGASSAAAGSAAPAGTAGATSAGAALPAAHASHHAANVAAKKGLGTAPKAAAGVAAVVVAAAVVVGVLASQHKPATGPTGGGGSPAAGNAGAAAPATEVESAVDITLTGVVSGHPLKAVSLCNSDPTHGYHVAMAFKGLPGSPNLYLIGPTGAGNGPFHGLEPLPDGTSLDTVSLRVNGNDYIAALATSRAVTWTLGADRASGTVDADLNDSSNPQGVVGHVKGTWTCRPGTLRQTAPGG